MRFYKLLSLGLTTLLITSCSETNYKFKLNTTKKTTLGEKAAIKFEQLKGEQIDSVHLYVNNKRVNTNETSVTINTADFGVGKHAVTALAFYPNKSKKLNNSIEILAKEAPAVYSYKIVNIYPHDKGAYTQGLEYKNGYLYESTGRNGESTLRKVELETGKVLQKIDLDEKYFGEGMTIFNNKIYWLTWHARKGFIYDFETFKQLGSFNYTNSNQGWGLTHNGSELIKTDGSNKIWFLDANNQQEKRSVQVYTNKYPVDNLNEIELINGKIYANKWQQNSIVIINPETGVVEGVANLNGLRDIVAKDQTLETQDDVLNGIAYDSENNRLFVTGKHWGKLFEIELIKQ
ncbi:glutaminyl-peptide cyclotransferase [Tenacibaculum sp. SSH1-16]|uniref:glutaminyl-peptide cyclotransferase n=1 Tax=Tenacibaculum TaxID=104267 RepID=UPI0012E58403|nr:MULTISPECIES: glutaminyl-peptide cyclotransferase [Tenacibaculum]GFD79370.1 glutamine cyclotransferase [Tenacibaculum sp. KUL118]GFD92635.1 glutamine cyclotransferase [Alteromonas sp. KUL154]GFE03613.1 glutamine cyclotransferase [Alteromonas sp. KUL156]KAF9658197.1 glutaminyl-peptide cyclotransferase [Tenacibaculum mesophilum]MCO7186347.1 glutaminyl-peptide cyclotransferase [Tenacibaculum sp. XPcli2-G]